MLQASYIGCPNVVKEIADKMSNSKVQPPKKFEGTLILLSLKLEQHGKFDPEVWKVYEVWEVLEQRLLKGLHW